MLDCMLHACAVQKLMNADPVVFLLDAPSVWVDKHVPMALSALLKKAASVALAAHQFVERRPILFARGTCLAAPIRYQLSRIQLPDFKETCHYTNVIEPLNT